jgi:outer membrane protein OmpA-like peptidoglycan-associated protein
VKAVAANEESIAMRQGGALRHASIICTAALLCIALLQTGCAKRTQVAVQQSPAATTASAETPAATATGTAASATPVATASGSTTASAAPTTSGSPSTGAGAAAQVTVLPTAVPTPTGPVNLLSFAAGTILRSWPESDPKYSPLHLLNDDYWKTKAGATGSLVLIYELPYPATIERFEFNPGEDPAMAVQHVRVEGSTTGPSSGYNALGDYQLQVGKNNSFSLSQPANARWLRVTLDARGGSSPTRIDRLHALGTMQYPTQAKPLAGMWLFDDAPLHYDIKLFGAAGSLPATVDYKTYGDSDYMYAMRVVEQGDQFRAGECWTTKFRYRRGGTQLGALSEWTNIGPAYSDTSYGQAIENAEGNMLVGNNNGDPWVALRLQSGPTCDAFDPPVGSGKKVVVLEYEGTLANYAPARETGTAGYRFVPQAAVLLTPETLAGADTAVLVNICDAQALFAGWQQQALLNFVSAGHKLIIHDADNCTKSNYTFLSYPFVTSNPGGQGSPGHHLVLVESDTLGSDKLQPQYFLDIDGYIKHLGQQIGDANTVVSQDTHWCGHLFGTNTLNANGFMQMYAPYGKGLFIYDGLDKDDYNIPTYQKIVQLEVAQPASAPMPCTQSVAGSFLVAPSQYGTFAPGIASSQKFDLQLLANQGWKGTVSLSATGDFTATVTPNSAQLSGGTQPLVVAVMIPANAQAVTHVIQVAGNDGSGHTAGATITLEPKQVIPKKFKRIRVYGIHFDVDSAVIQPRSEPVIAQIAAILKQSPTIHMQIEGHTDSDGGAAYNLGLSQRRAQSVVNDLVKRYGIARFRLVAKGYGLSRPVAPNTTPSNKALNRRVELVVL